MTDDSLITKPWERPGEGHNLIINTQETQRQFQDRLSLGERRVQRKANQLVEGTAPSQRAQDMNSNDAVANIKAWRVGPNWCADCTQQKPDFRVGPQMFLQPMPEIDMTPLDVAIFGLCKECFQDAELGGQLVVVDGDGDETDSRAERRERNIIEWCKAAKLRGLSPARFDGTGRRVTE